MSRYRNAKDVLPDALVREIQKYVRGEHLYIPQTERTEWGKRSGARELMKKRNMEIQQKYMDGISVLELAEMYGLSEERIRGILYEKSEDGC